MFSSSTSRAWAEKAPGYSATRSSASPAAAAVARACSVKPGAAIITDGIPSTSAAMHEPVSFGVHSPHPPLPETTASTPDSRSRRWKASFSRRTTPGRGYGPAEPISSSRYTFAVGYSARISRLSSGCVTFAMKLPPTSAIVLPSSEARRGAGAIGSTAASGTGESTSYTASPGAAGASSAHRSSVQSGTVAAHAFAASAAATMPMKTFMSSSPFPPSNAPPLPLLHNPRFLTRLTLLAITENTDIFHAFPPFSPP